MIENEIEQAAVKAGFSGVISIHRGEDDIFRGAFGYRNIAEKLPNAIQTRFGIASGTKLFTALGIGKLIDRGVLSLSTRIGEIDGGFRGFIDESATILQLLTHTSGIYDYYDEDVITDFDNFSVSIPWYRLETPSDYLPLFEGRNMKFRPGERFSYSNGGYVFLGIIIEKLTGGLFRDFMTDFILSPAGMPDSGFFAFNDLPGNTASGYLRDRKTVNIFILPIRGGGDGGMYATADDLHAFWKRFHSCTILPPELTREFLRTRHSFNASGGYGCGIYTEGDSVFSIRGGDAGVGFYSMYDAVRDMTVSVLSNITDGSADIMANIRKYTQKQ